MSKAFETFATSDLNRFIGEWLFFVDGNIVLHGKDIKTGYAEARAKHPGKMISVARVPSETSCIY